MGREHWQVLEVNEKGETVKVIAGQIEDKEIAELICQLPLTMAACGTIANIYMHEEAADYKQSKTQDVVHPFKYLCYIREAKDKFKVIYGILPSVTRIVREKPIPQNYQLTPYENE